VIADAWHPDGALLAIGRGAKLLRAHSHAGCPVTTSTTS
jgi:hypothetical protein